MNERQTWFCDAILLQRGKRLMFTARGGQLKRFGQPDRLGHGGIHHGLQARVAEQLEHGGGFLRARANVAADKPVGTVVELSVKAIRGNYGSRPQKASWIYPESAGHRF